MRQERPARFRARPGPCRGEKSLGHRDRPEQEDRRTGDVPGNEGLRREQLMPDRANTALVGCHARCHACLPLYCPRSLTISPTRPTRPRGASRSRLHKPPRPYVGASCPWKARGPRYIQSARPRGLPTGAPPYGARLNKEPPHKRRTPYCPRSFTVSPSRGSCASDVFLRVGAWRPSIRASSRSCRL